MREFELRRVEKQAREAALRELAVAREISVLLVARDREAQVRQVNPDLVRSAGEKVRHSSVKSRSGFSRLNTVCDSRPSRCTLTRRSPDFVRYFLSGRSTRRSLSLQRPSTSAR